MSDIPYPPLTNQTTGICSRLARLRGRVTTWFWVEGLGRVLWTTLAIFAADLLLDWAFRMDRAQRAVMLVLMGVAIGWAIFRWLVRPLSQPMSDDALALQVERANKRLGQNLITALQLSRTADNQFRGASPTLVRQGAVWGVKLAQEVSLYSVIHRRNHNRHSLRLL